MGIIAKAINKFIKVEPKTWIFGADKGQSYREGAKYLMEYVLKSHPDYHCTFVTQNPKVIDELNAKGIPCIHNFTWKAIFQIARAEAIFTTQSTADVRFGYKKKGRKLYYMMHGMSNKVSWRQLPKGYVGKLYGGSRWWAALKTEISQYLTIGYTMNDISFLSSTSDFFVPYIHLDFGDNIVIKNLGMPRNDGLFDHERIKGEKWVEGLDGKLVITYMPTHRAYGAGEITPTPFITRPEYQQWMRENGVVLLMKNHPNMIYKINDANETDVLKDITKMRLDPQVCLYHSDVLITDHSSVWIDYLLLKRPLVFYMYDDFEKDDVGTYYDVKDLNVGHFCYNENELFELIKNIKNNYDQMRPSEEVVNRFHKYADCKNSERYFNAVVEDLLTYN